MEEDIIHEGEFQYLEKGEGKVLLLLHGLFGALSNFEDVIHHFSKTHKVVVPLMPIYTLPVINTNVKNLAKFVHEFVEFKKYDKVNLVGNSLGGHVSLVYLTKHIDRVESVTLTGSSGLYENAMGGSVPRKGDRTYIENKVQETFYNPEHATEELVDECFEIVNDRTKLIRILALAKSAIRHNMGKELPNFNVPACLIWGKNDSVTPPEVAEEFHELLPQSELFWIDECGHAPMMEQPEQFNAILGNWLNKQGL